MKKALTTITTLYHYVDGEKVKGQNQDMNGDCSDLWGDCSGLSGSCSGLSGNLDNCEITEEDREKGIHIRDLVL